ncbi:PQQ-binding-like beta-propeller repeat protein [Nocardiopsis aegyptia]|uniref:outer membrane protein assembly factor BamB family protein n=1 Tax=Nocardiopsis aegyptia TaxID=220378 RepID=UPI00366DDFA5
MRRPAVLLALPLLLSACAVAPDVTAEGGPVRGSEDYLAGFEGVDDLQPSEISPDTELLCAGDRSDACVAEGGLRWSLPLEGDYYLRRESSRPLALYHADTGAHAMEGTDWLPWGTFAAAEADGGDIVVYAENARVHALDTATGELRWRVDLGEVLGEDGGGFLHTGLGGLHDLGDALLLRYERGLVVMDPESGDVDMSLAAEHPLGDLEQLSGDHAVLRSGQEDPVFTTVDLDRGEVVWRGRLWDDSGSDVPDYVGTYGDHAYVVWTVDGDQDVLNLLRPSGWFARVDIRTGELEYPIDADVEGLRSRSTLSAIHPDGIVVLTSGEGDEDGEGDEQYAYDYVEDRLLWERDTSSGELTPVGTPSGPAFEARPGELVNAVSGEPLPEGTDGEVLGSDRFRAGWRQLPWTDGEDGTIVTWVETGSSREGPIGVGTLGLLRTDSLVVAVACAPDGVREPDGPEASAPGAVCDGPRLYAVNTVG